MSRRAKPSKGKAEAKRARKAPQVSGGKVRDLEERLAEALKLKTETLKREAEALKREAEALEQQTATVEILRVIAGAQTDPQPVFDTIARNARALCRATFSAVIRLDGELLRLVAQDNADPRSVEAVERQFPMRIDAEGAAAARALRTREVVYIRDVRGDPDYTFKDHARDAGYVSMLGVPMLRDGSPIGVIAVTGAEVGMFSDRQVELLRTFADQAVIAIENARLFNETKEALEQQTATSEILRVIASSPTDVRPVFEAILKRAATLCEAQLGHLWLYEGGEQFRLGASYGSRPDHLQWLQQGLHRFGRPFFRENGPWRVGQVPDVRDTEPYRRGEPVWIRTADHEGMRTLLGVPLVKDRRLVGSIAVYRREIQPFTDQQTALVQTFADQAVIAIENVRLFTELGASNRELTVSLDKQTATADILRVISGSRTDVQPVFEAIMQSAVRLLDGYFGAMTRVVGDRIELAAFTSLDEAGSAAVKARFPMSLHAEGSHARAIRERVAITITDAQTGLQASEGGRLIARAVGYQSLVALPLLRNDEAIGALGVTRREAGGFTDDEIGLLQTFADQAVIAIENVRLFTELGARNRDLTEALEQQTATSEVLRAISGSTFDLAPVLQTLVENATRLCNARHGYIFKFDGEFLHPAADYGASPEFSDYWRQNPIRPGPNSTSGRAALERRTVHIHDVTAEPGYQYLGVQSQEGFRTVLAVPMLREDTLLGVITLWKTRVEPFSNRQIELVTTFADQAVIAIENVRLFTDLQARTGQLTRSVEELRALGEVGQALSSTLDLETVLTTIVERAVELSAADSGSILEYNETAEQFYLRVSNEDDEVIVALRDTPLRKGEGATGRMALTREPVQIPDIVVQGAYESRVREALLQSGRRALLAVPLLSEEHIIGGLVITRNAAGEFSAEVVELLRTFATQSALAIQNARLFHEIEDKSRELEAASRHKSEFLANMSHELRTPLNAIIGYSELLEEEAGDLDAGRLVPDLQKIATAAQHQLSLINDILDLSKVEAGRMELEVADFDLPTAIDNALTLFRERAARRGIALGSTLDGSVGSIRADERKVKQVLLNLLSNALKFTPEGGRIDVGAVMSADMAEVSVADSGVGIAPEDQEAVFEEFRQVGTADKKVEGTGLGLALCRRFVELHGGRIWVKSQGGQGSTFTFTLPVRREG